MRSAVDDVHHRHRQTFCIDSSQVTVQREPEFICRRPRIRQRNAENSVGAKILFVLCPVEFNHCTVERHLVERVEATDGTGDFFVDVPDRFENAFSGITVFVSVAQFESFVFSGRSSGRDRRRSFCAGFERNGCFNSRIPAGVENFPRLNFCNFGFHLEFPLFNECCKDSTGGDVFQEHKNGEANRCQKE